MPFGKLSIIVEHSLEQHLGSGGALFLGGELRENCIRVLRLQSQPEGRASLEEIEFGRHRGLGTMPCEPPWNEFVNVSAKARGFATAEAYAAARRAELEAAMAHAGISPSRLVALGWPDQGASLGLEDLARDLTDRVSGAAGPAHRQAVGRQPAPADLGD